MSKASKTRWGKLSPAERREAAKHLRGGNSWKNYTPAQREARIAKMKQAGFGGRKKSSD